MSYVTWECVILTVGTWGTSKSMPRKCYQNVYKNKTRILYIDYLFVLKTNMQVIL